MRLGKEIECLRQLVHKLTIEKAPSTICMLIIEDMDEKFYVFSIGAIVNPLLTSC